MFIYVKILFSLFSVHSVPGGNASLVVNVHLSLIGVMPKA